jgi:hypothetical protein
LRGSESLGVSIFGVSLEGVDGIVIGGVTYSTMKTYCGYSEGQVASSPCEHSHSPRTISYDRAVTLLFNPAQATERALV